MMGYKTYQTFDEYVVDQPADKQAIIAELRQFVAKTVPGLIESSKWGRGCWLNHDFGDLPVVFVHVEPEYVQLGFYVGAMLNDPAHVLAGNAKFIRHAKIYSPDDIDEQVLAPLVRQAAEIKYK